MSDDVASTELFGPGAAEYLTSLRTLLSSFAGTTYRFEPEEDFRHRMVNDPPQAVAVSWTEFLGRCHLASATAALRSMGWVDGMLSSYRQRLLLPFAASLRGLLESGADSYLALRAIPLFLAENRIYVSDVLNGRPVDNLLFAAPEVENLLIHFTHARRLRKGEAAPEEHRAMHVRGYLDTLKDAELPGVDACYSELCELTHPAARSVYALLETSDGVNVSIASDPYPDEIHLILNSNRELMQQLLMFAFNPTLLILAVLNRFSVKSLQTPLMIQWDLDQIPAWHEVRLALAQT